MQAIQIRALWPVLAAVAIATLFALWSEQISYTARLSNLDLEAIGFPETYLMTDKSEPGRGYVVGRRASTVRRSDSRQPGDKWRVRSVSSSSGDTWITQSKRKGKGTVLYVPYPDVPDPVFPFYYDFVREHAPDLDLPQVQWTSLLVNRVYRGLYLRISLPFDRRKKDGGSGILREILSVRGDELVAIDTRFDDAPGVYLDALAGGVFPELTTPPPALAWLARRAPTDETAFLLGNTEPWAVSLLPLPISLPTLFERLNGRKPASFQDARYERWLRAEWSQGAEPEPFDRAARRELADRLTTYSQTLRSAVRAHALLHRSSELLARLDRRLAEL